MHAHVVLAHPEPQSFNAHLAATARRALEERGWTTSLSDLYQQGFEPCEHASHYASPVQAARFDAQLEQRHASDHDALPAAVAAELALMDRADLIILQYPMWWHLPPAILKGWFDRVFAYGAVYTSTRRFENGRFVGKRAMLSLTVGSGEATYGFNGRSGDMDLLLWPVNFSLAFVGYTVLQPFVAYGVEAGLRYSAPDVLDARFRRLGQELAAAMATVEGRAAIPFNRMSEWGADGRIVADAPAYSPFIRHRKELAVE